MATSLEAPWITAEDVPGSDDLDPELVADATVVSSDILFQLTGRKYPGVTESTVRPTCGHDGGRCDCSSTSTLYLPRVPVVEVVEVVVDGELLASSEYSIIDGAQVVRRRAPDGTRRTWPQRQDLTLPTTEVGTWAITYRAGQAPPLGGCRAAGSLARQLALGWSADAAQQTACRLPKRVTTITRQGVSFAILDPLTLFSEGLTGLSEVDLWIQSDRYGSQRRAGAVFDTAGTVAPRWRDARRRRRYRRETPPGS